MPDLENQEFRECAAEFLASQPNYSPFNDWFYTLDMDQVRDLLARVMRIASEETWEEFGPSADMLPSDYGSIAEGISSRIKGEKGEK